MAASDRDPFVCDVGDWIHPDAHMIDALACTALMARRLGCRIALRHASRELRELIRLVGLADVLPDGADLTLDASDERASPR